MPNYNQDLSATSGNAPTKQVGVDPLTGQPVQQMTNVPPQQANTLGAAQPVFKPQAQQAAQGIYGSVDQRQNSVGATPLFQKEFHSEKGRVQPGLIKQWKPRTEPPVPEHVQPGLIKQHQPKLHTKPVYVPNRPKTIKLQKPYKDTKIVEKKAELKEVINQRL